MKTNRLLAALIFGYFATSGSIALSQTVTYCPQTLCGMASGSYYYYCETCVSTMHTCPPTYVCTDASYDTGGNCANCGGGCNEEFRFALKTKATQAADVGMDHVQCKITDYNKVPDVDYSAKDGFKRIDGRIQVNELTLTVKIDDANGNAKTHLFRCFDVDLSACPAFMNIPNLKPLRVGRRVKDGATPVAPPMQATRVSGKHHCHRLQVGERYFDVTSQPDIN